MTPMIKKPALLATILMVLGLAAACGSDAQDSASDSTAVATSESTATTSEPTVESTAVAVELVETADPDSVENFDQAMEAMAKYAAATTPEAAADFQAYFDGLSEAEQRALLAETFGITSEEETEAFVNRLFGISEEELATFEVVGTEAMMEGLINSNTPDDVRALIADHPEVTTIVMLVVPGSIDDSSNLEASQLVRDAGLNTHVTGQIASGGVDFFLAGTERTAGPDALFGVHSWADAAGNEGGDIPKDDPGHAPYLNYYEQVGIDSEFYWFTLEAAPAADVHWMTAEELETYGFITSGEIPTGAEIANGQDGFRVTAEDLSSSLRLECLSSAIDRGVEIEDPQALEVCTSVAESIEAEHDQEALLDAVNGKDDVLLAELTAGIAAALDTAGIGE